MTVCWILAAQIMQLWKGVARQIGSQGALKKLPAATSQFHGAMRIAFGPQQLCNGDQLKFWGLMSMESMLDGPRHTLFSSSCGIRWNATSAWEHAPGTARTNPGRRTFQILSNQYYSIEPPKYSAHFSLGAQWMNCWFWPKSLFDRFETNARWDIWNTLKKWKPARPSLILWPSVDCL